MLNTEILVFTSFSVFVLGVLLLDLLVIGRKQHVISFKESLLWTAVWVACAFFFYLFLLFKGDILHDIRDMEHLKLIITQYAPYFTLSTDNFQEALVQYRQNIATEFITGYLIEYTLSIDNIFVILMLLSAFSVNEKYYKKVLFFGILGAIILRCIFIFVGSSLIQRFEWILYVFGGFLIFSGIKMFIDRNKEEKIEPQKHWLVLFLSRYMNVYKRYVKGHFYVRTRQKKTYITPLFVVLIIVEFTDLVFAFDSIPAIFAVTRDPYIVFFSNIFAIMGLRSLFFLLAKIVTLFRYLKIGISVLLVFVGIKLIGAHFLHELGFKTIYSLYFILAVLTMSILLSVVIPEKKVISHES